MDHISERQGRRPAAWINSTAVPFVSSGLKDYGTSLSLHVQRSVSSEPSTVRSTGIALSRRAVTPNARIQSSDSPVNLSMRNIALQSSSRSLVPFKIGQAQGSHLMATAFYTPEPSVENSRYLGIPPAFTPGVYPTRETMSSNGTQSSSPVLGEFTSINLYQPPRVTWHLTVPI